MYMCVFIKIGGVSYKKLVQVFCRDVKLNGEELKYSCYKKRW